MRRLLYTRNVPSIHRQFIHKIHILGPSHLQDCTEFVGSFLLRNMAFICIIYTIHALLISWLISFKNICNFRLVSQQDVHSTLERAGIFKISRQILCGKSAIFPANQLISDRLHVVCAQLIKEADQFAAAGLSQLNETVQLWSDNKCWIFKYWKRLQTYFVTSVSVVSWPFFFLSSGLCLFRIVDHKFAVLTL